MTARSKEPYLWDGFMAFASLDGTCEGLAPPALEVAPAPEPAVGVPVETVPLVPLPLPLPVPVEFAIAEAEATGPPEAV